MKRLIVVIFSILTYQAASAQFVARMQPKDTDTLTGVCDRNNIITVLSMFKEQQEAVCSVSEKEIEKRLNSEVIYLKGHLDDDKGIVGIVINCQGEVIQCKIDNKTKSEELDRQILAVFITLTNWKPAKLNSKKVDSMRLFGFDIEKGKIVLH
jgi:DNA-binding protein YbaB